MGKKKLDTYPWHSSNLQKLDTYPWWSMGEYIWWNSASGDWWYVDETAQFCGPCDSKEQAQKELAEYSERLG